MWAVMITVDVATVQGQLSALVARVSEDGETIVVTRDGERVAKLVPVETVSDSTHLADVKGWLEDDDPFFSEIETIVESRLRRRPRMPGRS